MNIKEMHDKVVEIIGEGETRYTEISIYSDKIEIITDKGITVSKLCALDKYFEQESYIKARNEGLLYIRYNIGE